MYERPIILFPEPESANRSKKNPNFSKKITPTFDRQFDRLQPQFSMLRKAFEQKRISIQKSPIGINPDFALVFEVVDSVDNFYIAVKHCEGLDWIFDTTIDDITPDEDFYEVDSKTGERKETNISGKVYCVMTNQSAMNQLLMLWEKHNNGEEKVFKRGFAGIKNVFTYIKKIRKWNSNDRIAETHALEYWRESLSIDGKQTIPFEIELFYRMEEEKREKAIQLISSEINQLGGNVIQECLINEIAYHALMVQLPRNAIEDLIIRYHDIHLAQVDDIMFFHPVCQSSYTAEIETAPLAINDNARPLPEGNPLIAVFDGMPVQNHSLLKDRLIIDDPDDFSSDYLVKHRIHGTAMASPVIYGDLNKSDKPISRPIYFRPILKPKECIDGYREFVPERMLFIDVIHRAIKRILIGENGEGPVAPSVKVINLSIGDPARELATLMSPLARLLDYFSYTYKILFIVSAGNHQELLEKVDIDFSDFKKANFQTRNRNIFQAIANNRRNMKILSPAENINGLTIGALYDDYCNNTENDRFIYAVNRGLPSPASSFGKGYRSLINPDLFYYGGRKFVMKNIETNGLGWAYSNSEPGCKVAAPYSGDRIDGQSFSAGTSNAAAQITHEASKCFDILSDVFIREKGYEVPKDFQAILLKAMITHGASWENISNSLADAFGCPEKQLSTWIGNGVPNLSKVKNCTKDRITLIGFGSLGKDKGDVFRLPLPIDFSSQLIKRKLTVTLAYFTPIECSRQLYRSAQLWYEINDPKKLIPNRQNTEWLAVRRGTLQHEIFKGERPIVWNDNDAIDIKVNCKEDAGKIRNEIPYCIFVTFEIAEGLDVDIYIEVSERIRQRIPIAGL